MCVYRHSFIYIYINVYIYIYMYMVHKLICGCCLSLNSNVSKPQQNLGLSATRRVVCAPDFLGYPAQAFSSGPARMIEMKEENWYMQLDKKIGDEKS